MHGAPLTPPLMPFKRATLLCSLFVGARRLLSTASLAQRHSSTASRPKCRTGTITLPCLAAMASHQHATFHSSPMIICDCSIESVLTPPSPEHRCNERWRDQKSSHNHLRLGRGSAFGANIPRVWPDAAPTAPYHRISTRARHCSNVLVASFRRSWPVIVRIRAPCSNPVTCAAMSAHRTRNAFHVH